MIDDEPLDLSGATIVFGDDFHGLFHPWYSRECDNRCLHVKYAWTYQWSEWLRSRTLCRVGRHRVVKAWKRPSSRDSWSMYFTCNICAYEPPLKVPA